MLPTIAVLFSNLILIPVASTAGRRLKEVVKYTEKTIT